MMNGMLLRWMDATCFILLALSVMALWTRTWIWSSFLVASIIVGYVSGVLTGIAVLWVALSGAACQMYARSRHHGGASTRYAALGQIAIVLLGLALGLHVLPGIHNRLVVARVVLSPGAAPYDLWLNFDKTVAGLLLMGLCYQGLIRSRA